MMNSMQIHKLTLAGLFAALAFACFSYLRIEIPMGLGLTGKIYVGHTFIMLSALFLGAKYGALSGAVGLTLADILAGYTTSAPPTFLAKFILGWVTAAIFHAGHNAEKQASSRRVFLACAGGAVANVITEPLIRFSFKYFILGIPREVAYVSALNCCVSMAVSNVVCVILSLLLYKAAFPIVSRSLQN